MSRERLADMNVWQIPYTYLNLKPGQSLFIQQWGVETSGRSPLVSLRLRTSIKELLREIVDLTTLVETGQMKSRSLASIADELKYHLHANDLLRGSFPEDIALLNDIVRKNTDPNDIERWKTVRIVVSAFLKKLDAVNFLSCTTRGLKYCWNRKTHPTRKFGPVCVSW